MQRRHFLAAASSLAVASPMAWAQAYPHKPIKFIITHAAGGLPDTVARIYAQRLSERLGQPVTVDNRPGANGMVAAQAMALAPKDGYTFMVTDGSTFSINPLISKSLSYDYKRDFVAVSLAARAPLYFAVHPKTPAHNLRELIDQRSFRDDLYYRINGLSVKLPPLRSRTDVAALCQKILNELSPHHALTIAPSLMRAFLRYSWPGNLRQLNNVLKTAAIMAVGSHEISTEHLADDFIEDLALLMPDAGEKLRTSGLFESTLATPDSNQWGDLKAPAISTASDNLEQVEIATIRRVLDACGGNVSTASKQLNISRNTIYRKLKKQA